MIELTAKRYWRSMELSRLKELLEYDPNSGIFTWKISRGSAKAGSSPRPNGEGYLKVKIDGKHYQCHNLAWLISTGSWPEDLIDHKDCDTTNNRLCNLRPATRKGNADNASKRKDNKSGVKGVSWKATHSKWVAQCSHLGRVHYLGLFEKLEDAAKVVAAFRDENHGDFANHGGLYVV